MTCQECHHLPSYRFNSEGSQCYCKCHDQADNNNAALRQSLEDFRKYLVEQLEEWKDQLLLLLEFSGGSVKFKVLDSSGLAGRNFNGMSLDFCGWNRLTKQVILKQPPSDVYGNICGGTVTMDLNSLEPLPISDDEIQNAVGQIEAIQRILEKFHYCLK